MILNIELLFKALTYIWFAGELLLALFTRTSKNEGKIQDYGTQLALWAVIVASLWIDQWMHKFLPIDMPGGDSWLRPVAFGILILGLGVRITAFVTLGRAFSANVAVRTDQRLQRGGLYGLVRHPSYLGLELILLAFAIHARTWACFAVVLVPPTLAMLFRIHVEETALRAAFGTEYENYCRRTKRLIPGMY